MHSLSEYPSRTCLTHHMWSKRTLKGKGGEKYHVHSTERTWNVTLGADNLTFKVGALGDFRKKKINYLHRQFDDPEQSFQTLGQWKLNRTISSYCEF